MSNIGKKVFKRTDIGIRIFTDIGKLVKRNRKYRNNGKKRSKKYRNIGKISEGASKIAVRICTCFRSL